MVILRINNTKVKIITEWQDMTIEQAIQIMAIEVPESVKDSMYDVAAWNQGVEGFKYAAKVFEILSTFSHDLIQKTNAADIMLYFVKYHLGFVIDLHSQTPGTYEPTGQTSFRLDGVDYLLPESLKVESQILPVYSSKAVEFVESSNILSVIADLGRDGIKHLPMFIATYCRPAGEKYDERVIQKRAELFKRLPMSVAWEVFFCIQRLMLSYSTNILRYTAKQVERYRMQLRVQGLIAAATRLGFIRWRKAESPAQLTQLN